MSEPTSPAAEGPGRCRICDRELTRSRPALPLCDDCTTGLGIGPAAREYLESVWRSVRSGEGEAEPGDE